MHYNLPNLITNNWQSFKPLFSISQPAKLLLFFFAFASCYNYLNAQNLRTGTIQGTILDQQNKPIAFATIALKGTATGAFTDANGKFILKDIPMGTQTLQVSFTGYETKEVLVQVEANQTVNTDIVLEESVNQLKEVVIESETEKTKLQQSTQAVTVVELQEAQLKTPDLGEVLARTEGVAIQRSGGLGSGIRLSLNGLTDDQVRIFYDDVPLEFSGMSRNFANVPSNLINRIEVYKGVVPIRFGTDALGGMVNLATSLPQKNELTAMASYQVGSFGTHRLSSSFGKSDEESGFFIKALGFYDFARNDYDIQVQFADASTNFQQVEITVPRFNDRFQQYGSNLTVGFRNKKWADEVSISGYFFEQENQIQSNPAQTGLPFGEVESLDSSIGINAKYGISLSTNVSINIVGGYNESERKLIDLATNLYNWLGEPITINEEVLGEIDRETGIGADRTTSDKNYFGRFNLTWDIHPQHSIKFVLAPTGNERSGRDEAVLDGVDIFAVTANLKTWISGLDYRFKTKSDKIENRLFVKNYLLKLDAVLPSTFRAGQIESSSNLNEWGFGNVFRINLTEQITTKLSYEWTARLPNRFELFGDGTNILGNPELEPERSHNANVEVFLKGKNKVFNSWTMALNGFVRATDNLIFLVPNNEFFSSYDNVLQATSKGIEARGTLGLLKDKLKLDANTTYFSFRNTGNEGIGFNGDRIPNRPYFFVNASANYEIPSPLRRLDKINLYGTTRYVKSFFRTWESAGTNKPIIPSQHTYNTGITYDMVKSRLRVALTAEIQNLTNERVFDFFGVQRPGRAYYMKITTQI
ncbi:MAG: carboxypeptidase-like regulatory domain-containing protein [Bacteroidota bacterium]